VENRNIFLKKEGGKRCRGVITDKRSDERPLVSIITAVYNGNQTIEETIKSVINQIYMNFEYIIVDGGSIDGTIDTIKKYDKLIYYWVSEPDRGIYDALNKGIDLARGEWLYFLGADDIFVDDTALQSFFSEPRDTKMLYGNVVRGRNSSIYDGQFSKFKLCRTNICQQAIFYHQSLFKEIGYFDFRYVFAADWVFNMKAFAAINTNPLFVDRIVAKYSEEGLSSQKHDPLFIKERLKLIRQIFGPEYLLAFIFYDIYTGIKYNFSKIIDLVVRKISKTL
jgi:glycosyltransferase involved in cell wall biosynthesis